MVFLVDGIGGFYWIETPFDFDVTVDGIKLQSCWNLNLKKKKKKIGGRALLEIAAM